MTPEQEIRSMAVQAGGNFLSNAKSTPEDFIAICQIFATYIEHGDDAGFKAAEEFKANYPPEAEKHQPTGLQSAALVEPMVQSAPAARQSAPVPQPSREPAPVADAIPAEMSKPVSAKQTKAMEMVNKTREARARKFLDQSRVAVVKAHLINLITEVEDSDLADFPIVHDGENRGLGSHLQAVFEKRFPGQSN